MLYDEIRDLPNGKKAKFMLYFLKGIGYVLQQSSVTIENIPGGPPMEFVSLVGGKRCMLLTAERQSKKGLLQARAKFDEIVSLIVKDEGFILS